MNGREKIEREVAILKRCNHQNIVSYLGHNIDQGLYMFMEYLPIALFDMIKETASQRKTFSLHDVVVTSRCIADGLHYLHSLGVIHRDIKVTRIHCTQLMQ